MERVRFVIHNQQQILLHDLSGCDSSEFVSALKLGARMILAEPDRTHLVLVDVSGMSFGPEIIGAAKEYIEMSKDVVKAVAVVGLNGFQESMFTYAVSASRRQISAFRDHGQAKDWLLMQSG